MYLITARTCISVPVILLQTVFSGCRPRILMRPLREKNGQLHLQRKCEAEDPACPGAGEPYRGRRRDPFCALGLQGNHRSFQPDQKFLWKMQDFQPWSWTVTAVTRPISSDGQVSTRLQAYLEMLSEGKEEKPVMIHYVCKYTPLELFKGFGEECAVLEEMPENFELSDQIAHANLCGFGKSVIQAVLEGKVEQLVLVNCCDSMRRVYDIVESTGKCKFLYMLDMPHEDNDCEKVKLAQGIHRLKKAYEKIFPG